ncbi:MAG: UDP-glucose/GDP-mannose dehydrogenase family protein [Alphaproteobacteria bacterium]|nr:UDP-glucose/GDP-mannose dehydrogenase family protein [Alphaproteobacteria bacterium]
MKITVVGTGYVGLVSGTCLAEVGHEVTCVDNVEQKVTNLKQGIIPIYEPGLDELVINNAKAGRLHFTTDFKAAMKTADIIMIAVGTPCRSNDGCADLRFVYGVAQEIAESLDHYAVIVTKSTVPAGTGHEIARIIKEQNPDAEFDIASNPEFLREGNAIVDFMEPDRVVVGTETDKAREVMTQLYAPFSEKGYSVLHTDIISSELIKYAANTFLATKVSFINEMADLCEKIGGNVQDIANGMGMDSRIGHKFLQPGPGYGGSCFPKDTLAMVNIGERVLSQTTIVEAVIAINRARPHRMVAKIANAVKEDLRGKTVALLGLTFKPDTDDVRDSTALIIAEELVRAGAKVVAYDPQGMEEAEKSIGNIITYANNKEEALQNADVMVLATEWKEFCELTPQNLKSVLKQPVVVDLRNVFDPAEMEAQGFTYHSVGRPAVDAYIAQAAVAA